MTEYEVTQAPQGAYCAKHPETEALYVCKRCGNFTCQDCLTAFNRGGFCEDCAERTPYLESLEAQEVISKSWNLYKENAAVYITTMAVFIGVSIPIAIISMVANIGMELNPSVNEEAFLLAVGLLYLGLQFISYLIYPWQILAFSKIGLQAIKGEATFKDMVPGLANYLWALLALMILGFMYVFGILLLIVPVFLVLISMLVWSYVLVDEKVNAFSALAESARLTNGYWGKLFVLGVVFFMIHVAAYSACILPMMFVSLPMAAIAKALVYDYLRHQRKTG